MNTCKWCGTHLYAIRSSKKYCSAACKQNAYLKRFDVKYDDNQVVYDSSVKINKDNEAKSYTENIGNNQSNNNLIALIDAKQSLYAKKHKALNIDNSRNTVNDDKLSVKSNSQSLLPVVYTQSNNSLQTIYEDENNYQWVVPELFTKLEEQMRQNDHRKYFRHSKGSYFNQQLTTQWKSILHQVLQLGYQLNIDRNDFITLYNAVIQMATSTAFRVVTNYVYKNKIELLIDKWSALLDKTEDDDTFDIAASLKQSALQMLCEIGDTVKHIPFDTLFENVNDVEEE